MKQNANKGFFAIKKVVEKLLNSKKQRKTVGFCGV